MARILTHQEVSAYLEWIRKGEGLSRSARRLGLDPKLFRDARRANEEFDEAVRAAEHEAAEPVENKLYEAALQGEPWAVKLWLERRSPERWNAPPIAVNVQHGLAPGTEQILALSQRLEERSKALGLSPGDGVEEVIDAEVVEEP